MYRTWVRRTNSYSQVIWGNSEEVKAKLINLLKDKIEEEKANGKENEQQKEGLNKFFLELLERDSNEEEELELLNHQSWKGSNCEQQKKGLSKEELELLEHRKVQQLWEESDLYEKLEGESIQWCEFNNNEQPNTGEQK